MDPSTARLIEQPRDVQRIASEEGGLVALTRAGVVHRWGRDYVFGTTNASRSTIFFRQIDTRLVHTVFRYETEAASITEHMGSCVVDTQHRLRCGGEGAGGELESAARAGVLDAAGAVGLCAVDEDRSLYCLDANPPGSADRGGPHWARRLEGPVLGLVASGLSLCAVQEREVACRGLRPPATAASERVDAELTRLADPSFDVFQSIPRPQGAELLLLDGWVCFVAASGTLTCPPELAVRLSPVWVVDGIR